jgi:molybdate transport system regulatory protein
MIDMKINYKIWLEENERLFGDGPCDILKRVDRLGSLRKAAFEINMSYSQAWKLINSLENKLGFKLMEKRVGGASGGGSILTVKGRLLMERFAAFRKEAEKTLNKLEKKYFNEEFFEILKG